MNNPEVARLNRILGDSLGRNNFGEPIYKWIWSRELTFPMRATNKQVERSGLIVFEPTYTQEPQVEGDAWVLAKWLAPCDPDLWLKQFGTEAGYPSRGLYYMTDIILVDSEPVESLTRNCIGAIENLRSKTLSQIVEEIQTKMDNSEKSSNSMISDFVDDSMTAFGNVPGKRGGLVSFGGI